MALDAATRAFLDKMAAAAAKPRHLLTPDEARAGFRNLRLLLAPGAEVAEARDLAIPVEGGTLRSRLYIPAGGEPQALLVYFHGGGWVVGGIEEFEPMCRDLAAGANVAVALVECRKAPEHAFPGPLDDAWAALKWLAANRVEFAGSDLPLLVGGDSAGGNLAIAVTLRARDENGPRIRGQLLVYPVTDCRFDRASYTDPDNQLMLTTDVMKYYWGHYVPDETQRASPLASPCRAESLRGLPPAVVVTAEHDVLRDEGEEYAQRLQAADVPVELERRAGQMHGFLMMRGILPGSDSGMAYTTGALKRLVTTIQQGDLK
ncbi:alpha/beta hydrolase fold domain-containing protein [Ramlibacter sp.]|uniref:alpha/beta hydrolase n=1 Tax=Ramlibacter sp. TaxID=1917967 RepID=UPI003D0FE636